MITIDLGTVNGKHTFKSFEDVQTWRLNEIDQWQWISSVSAPELGSALRNSYQSSLDQYGIIAELLFEAIESNDDAAIRKNEAALERHARRHRDCEYVLSSSTRGKLVQEIRKTYDDETAVGALLGITQITFHLRKALLDLRLLRGMVIGATHVDLAVEKDAAAAKTIDERLSNWEEKFVDLSRQSEEKIATLEEQGHGYSEIFNSKLNDFQEQKTSSFEVAKNIQSKYRRIAKKFLKRASKEHTELRDLFEKHMALKAPVEYWKAKRNGHRKSIILISIASVTVLVAGLWSLSIAPVDEIANRLFADDLLPHGKLVIFGFVATLLVWLLRILVRILFAQIKQAGDAEQRSVMTQTYLALLEASNISHEEKLLVFAAIFSPTDASAISDVNHPVTPLEVVGSLAQRLTK